MACGSVRPEQKLLLEAACTRRFTDDLRYCFENVYLKDGRLHVQLKKHKVTGETEVGGIIKVNMD
jgi:hypothetical protein